MSIDTIQAHERAEDAKLDEYELHRRRLRAVEEEASDGLYGSEALLFLASVERECSIVDDPDLIRALHEGSYDHEKLRQAVADYNLRLPDDLTTLAVMTPAEKETLEDYYKQLAREYVAAIPAKSLEEEDRKKEWLANIDTFTTADIINFRLYLEFSTPTLGDTAPPKSFDRSTMVEHSDQNGWIEFRFGNGVLQQGYYDNPGSSEYRLTPCPPLELIEREEMIEKRFLEIAAEHGAILGGGGRHINMSVYKPHYRDYEWHWDPIIGRQPERRQETLEAVSGLNAAIEDGAWFHYGSVTDRFKFGDVAKGIKWIITTQRNSIRILDDYFELRDVALAGSTAHGLLWMMSAISYGIERGIEGVSDDGHTAAHLTEAIVATRTPRFDKEVDLQLQRALEQSELSAHNFLKLDEAYASNRGEKLMTAVLGDVEIKVELTSPFVLLFMISLDILPDGRLKFDPDAYRRCFARLPKMYSDVIGDLSDLMRQDVIDAAERFVARDAVRIEKRQVIGGAPQFPGRAPDDWEDVWAMSPIVQRMYGNNAAQYGAELFATARKHYVPFDINDPAQFQEAMLELLARSNKMNGAGR